MAADFQPDNVRSQLERVVNSKAFASSARSGKVLRFLVEETLNGNAGELKEYTIGAQALERGDSFDPRTDPIVRAEASRLRTRLALYYATEGLADALEISLPKGGYVPGFETRTLNRANPPGSDRQWKITALVCAAVAVIALWWSWRARDSGPAPLRRFEIELRSGGSLGGTVSPDVAISPDGSRLVFIAQDTNAVARLYTLRLEEGNAVALEGTEGARDPFFSPDGQWIAFQANGKLRKVPMAGGPAVVLCSASDSRGGSWSPDGNIYAVLDTSGKLRRLPGIGGSPITVADISPALLTYPQVLPGSTALLLTSMLGGATAIEVLSLEDGSRKVVARGTAARYLRNGYLVYLSAGTLFAMAFDAARRQTRGAPVAILNDVAYSLTHGFAHLAFSENGTVVYRRSSNLVSIEWLDASGKTAPLVPTPARYIRPRFSPDGTRLAYGIAEASGISSWAFGVRTGTRKRLTSGDSPLSQPMWTPDSRFLLFAGPLEMSWLPGDGAGEPAPLEPKPPSDERVRQVPLSVSPNGTLVYLKYAAITGPDLWTMPLKAAGGTLRIGEPEPFQATPAFETQARFSPDGHWIAYNSTVSGSWEIYVQSFPRGAPVQVSIGGGRIPMWSETKPELFYATERQQIMKLSYAIRGGAFVPSPPVAWTERRFADTGVVPALDLHPDGKRFAALMPAESPGLQQSPNHATVLLNFFDEVERRVAAHK